MDHGSRAGIAFGMSWDHPKKGRMARAILAMSVFPASSLKIQVAR
jgi:hypothetical protein